MGDLPTAKPVKLFCGILVADTALLPDVESSLVERFGAIDIVSDVMPFVFTDYYEEEMGPRLSRKFVAFEPLADPGVLADAKLRTIQLERRYVGSAGALGRAVNLDPGYVTAHNLVLATTKDFAHRVYLGSGIYAEVTLRFRKGSCEFFDWTYPDFRSPEYAGYILRLRQSYLAATRT